MRGLMLAVQFLTRIPVPELADFRQEELSRSAAWFPLVGLLLGGLLLLASHVPASSWLAALIVLLLWLGVTGGLHLDGAADLADALGASHGDAARFQAVLKDPHVGAFGVMAVAVLILTKLIAVAELLAHGAQASWALLLIPAWARLGAVNWSQSLPPIAAGLGERFAWQVPMHVFWLWGVGLAGLSLLLLPWWFACWAVAALGLWRVFLKRRVGGMSGDCLGAGIEVCEAAMLLAVALG